MMETTSDGGEFLSDEILNALEAPQFCMMRGKSSYPYMPYLDSQGIRNFG
jgi:hypothetical protein